jgi:hypothetical protein
VHPAVLCSAGKADYDTILACKFPIHVGRDERRIDMARDSVRGVLAERKRKRSEMCHVNEELRPVEALTRFIFLATTAVACTHR